MRRSAVAIWRLNVFGDHGNGAGRVVNVFHVRTGNLVTTEQAAVNGAASALRAFMQTMAAYYPSLTAGSMKCDFAVNVQTGEDLPISTSTFAPVIFAGGAVAAPPHLAICVNWKTSIRGRRARGRSFLGPLVQSTEQADGSVVDTVLTTLGTAAQTLINASLVDNDWALGVWGLENPAPKDYAGDYSDLPHVIRDFTGYSISDKFAVMRSRRP